MEAKPNLPARLKGFFKGLNKNLRYALIGVFFILLVLIAVIALNAANVEYEILKANITPDEAAQIYPLLDDWAVPYKLSGSLAVTIEVPKGQRDSLLLRLRNEGYPGSISDTYTSYGEEAMGIGSTEYDKRIYHQNMLSQQIAYSVKQLKKVKNASVIVTLAQSNSYALGSSSQEAQATLTLELVDPTDHLTQSEADAVRSIVQMAVGSLKPENISITDTNMRNYRPPSEDNLSSYGDDQLDLKRKAQNLIQDQVYNILSPVFGYNNLRVSASVELDFDRRTTQSVTYEPPGDQENLGLIVSLDQAAYRTTGNSFLGGVVGFDPNGAAPVYPEAWTEAEDSEPFYYSQKLNAEVNEVREQVEQQMGKFKTIKVSVVYEAGDEWDAQAQTLRSSVATSVGIDPENVMLMRTAFEVNKEVPGDTDTEPLDEGAMLFGIPLQYLLIALGVVLLFGLLILLMQSSAKKRKKAYEAQIAQMAEEARLLEAQQMAIEQQQELSEVLQEDDPVKVRLNEIQNLASEQPDTVAQLLRNWLMDDFGR